MCIRTLPSLVAVEVWSMAPTADSRLWCDARLVGMIIFAKQFSFSPEKKNYNNSNDCDDVTSVEGSVPSEHAFLNLKNKNCKPGHLCCITVLSYNALRSHFVFIQDCSFCTWDIAIDNISISVIVWLICANLMSNKLLWQASQQQIIMKPWWIVEKGLVAGGVTKARRVLSPRHK